MRRPVVVPRRGEFLWARLRLRRREVSWWLGAVGLLALTAVSLFGQDGAVDATSRWGAARPVTVATRLVPVGGLLDADSVDAVDWPSRLVPPDAAIGPVIGRVAIADIAPGEIVVEHRLADEGLTGPSALLPSGTRALAVPTAAGGLDLGPGDLVDLLATTDPFSIPGGVDDETTGGGGTTVVAPAVTVVSVTAESVTVAVPVDRATDVAAALGQGVVTLALVPPLDSAAPDPDRIPAS